jgi:peptidoglycan/LPS O-acetylase OafA/YrhL
MDEATGSRPRFRELDVFRRIAAIGVVLFHIGPRYEARGFALAPDPPILTRVVAWLATALPDVGLLPVFWFFTISGFVITWTLERCEMLAGFARSRAARLCPVYSAATLLTVAVGATCAGFFGGFLLAIRGWLRGIVFPPLLWLGSISYALYVSHETLGWRLLRALEAHGVSRVGAIVVGIAATLALADGLTRLVERPVRREMQARPSYQWRWTP